MCEKCIFYNSELTACMIQRKDREKYLSNEEKLPCIRVNDEKYILVKNKEENFPYEFKKFTKKNESRTVSFTIPMLQ